MSIVYSPFDAAISFRSDDLVVPSISRAIMPQVLASEAGVPAAPTRFESMALLTGEMPPKDRDLLCVLLGSAFPVNGRGCEVLRPLWDEEAMHRAYSFVRLVDTRNGNAVSPSEDPIVDAIAGNLVARFRDLASGGEREVVPCADVLGNIITGLVALFGSPANVILNSSIEQLTLPTYKRRALVLAACELVCNALLHAFHGRTDGVIEVGLVTDGPKSAYLRVADNGIGLSRFAPDLAFGVGAGLASLLEADLTYERMPGWTIAEIAFPVAESWHGG
jgi:anti-sigma regulatory factor (Ser/Thr protein kinase)